MPDSTSDSESDGDCTCDEPQGFSEAESPPSDTAVDTLDDDIHVPDTALFGALEDLPLVEIGTSSDWNFFDIVTTVESKLCSEQKEKFLDALYSQLESKVSNGQRERQVTRVVQSFPWH